MVNRVTQILSIHPDNPQVRLARLVADCIRDGGIVAYPTDSAYALGCQIGDKRALDRIRQLRDLDKDHNFTLVCKDLSELATYARVDNTTFRLLKSRTPGPYTFILTASKEVPRRLQHPKRKTIGLRVPDNKVTQAILDALGEPLMSVTLILPGQKLPVASIDDMYEKLNDKVDIIADGGSCGFDPTTIVDLTGSEPEVVRVGKGDVGEL